MKKFAALIVTGMFLLSSVLFAQAQAGGGTTASSSSSSSSSDSVLQEKTLIDFGKLDASDVNNEIKFDNWRIHLSGLSDNPESRILSDLKMVDVNAGEINKEANGESFNHVLGIRVHFAYGYNNDWAQITTEDPISPFQVQSEEGDGVLRNVGPIEEVSIMIRGMNYMHSVEVRMKDQDGKSKNVTFGSLYFNGWKRLVWKNPNYIADKRKRNVVKIHMYPHKKPMLVFDSIVLYKSPNEKGGDFVTYVKDVKVKYEPYFTREIKDIDNEAVWGIHKAADAKKKKHEDLMRWLKYSGSNREDEYLKEQEQQNK